MTKDQIYFVNGFSNKFSGWGGEDDDMYNRSVWMAKLISDQSGADQGNWLKAGGTRDRNVPLKKKLMTSRIAWR